MVSNQYGEEYIAGVPKSVSDFEKEAENQRHCVLSYAEGMANKSVNSQDIIYLKGLAKANRWYL